MLSFTLKVILRVPLTRTNDMILMQDKNWSTARGKFLERHDSFHNFIQWTQQILPKIAEYFWG